MLLAIKTFGFVRTREGHNCSTRASTTLTHPDVGWGTDDESTMPAIRNEPTTKGKRVVSHYFSLSPQSLTLHPALINLAREGPRSVPHMRKGPQPQS
jgi:hypothetical protein